MKNLYLIAAAGAVLVFAVLVAVLTSGDDESADDSRLADSAPVTPATAPPAPVEPIAAATTAPARAELTEEVRARVDALTSAVAATPTSKENFRERADLVWQWANAFALAGNELHPSLPAVIAVTAHDGFLDGPVTPTMEQMFASIDAFIADLVFREANPDALGPLVPDTTGPFIADSYATISQTYTVGAAPVEPGGGFLFTPYVYTGLVSFQTSDPSADDYLAISSSNPDARFEVTSYPVSGIMSDRITGPAIPRPFFRLTEGTLQPGDTVTVTLGETSQGSNGYKIPNFQNTGLRMRVWVFLNEETGPLPLPETPFPIVGKAVQQVSVVVPSIVAAGEPFAVSVRNEDEYRNRATGEMPGYQVFIEDEAWRGIPAGGPAISVLEGAVIEEPGIYRLSVRSEDGTMSATSNPVLVESQPDRRLYWGETHGHSGYAEGNGTVDGYYTFAREDARLDFAMLSEHDLWMDDYEWEQLRQGAIRHNDPGAFVAFLGYEWTQAPALGGHHNVMFRTPEGRTRGDIQRAPRPNLLYDLLRAEHDTRDVLIIPHAHAPGDHTFNDPEMELFVEITSNHGVFEWFGRRYLNEGHRVGFLGSSDDHVEHPGLRILRTDLPQSDYYGGLAGVYAAEKTPDSIFDALHERAGYATTGERIILEARVNGTPMGGEIVARGPVEISGQAIGTAPIEFITLVRGGRDVATLDYTRSPAGEPATQRVSVRLFSDSDPRQPRVNARWSRIWRGTLEVRGARIAGFEAPRLENVFTEYLRRQAGSDTTLEMFLRTHGTTQEILLELEGAGPDTEIVLDTNSIYAYSAVQIGDAVATATTFRLGDLAEGAVKVPAMEAPFTDHVSARLAPGDLPLQRSFSFRDTAEPGSSFYIRVEQADGHSAWTSPVFVD